MIGIALNTVVHNFCLSLALQTFYRKSFSTANLPQFLCFLTLGSLPPLAFFLGEPLFNFLVAVRIPLVCFATYIWRDNCRLVHLLLVFIFLLEYNYNLLISSPIQAIIAQLVVSLTQFIRKPLALKNNFYIREIRVFMGPIYVLCSVRSFSLVHSTFGSAYTSLGALTFASAALAFVGGVLFRPDNDFLLKKLGWETTQQDRRLHHRNCMILSAATSFLCVLIIQMVLDFIAKRDIKTGT